MVADLHRHRMLQENPKSGVFSTLPPPLQTSIPRQWRTLNFDRSKCNKTKKKLWKSIVFGKKMVSEPGKYAT